MLIKNKEGSLLSGSAVYLVSNIISAAIPFALLPILTRYMTPREYGEVALFQTLVGALSAFVGVSIVGAAARKVYDQNLSDEDLRQFIAACLQILTATGIIVFALIYLVREPLSDFLNLRVDWVLWSVFVCAAGVLIQLRLGQWQVRKEAYRYGKLQVTRGAFDMACSLVLVVLLAKGAQGRFDAILTTAGLFAAFSLMLLHRDRLLSLFHWRPEFLKEALAFGVPLIPHIVGLFLLTSVDRFVINGELGLADTGIYMVAVQIAGAVGIVFDAINKAYVPWLYERLQRDRLIEKQRIVVFTYAWFAFILMGAGLAFLVGPWLVVLLAGEQYAGAGDAIGWLVLGQVFGGMYLMVTNYIFYSKRTGLLSLVSFSAGLIGIVLLLLLVQPLGLVGAAMAYCAGMALRFVSTWWVAQMRHPMPWFNFGRKV